MFQQYAIKIIDNITNTIIIIWKVYEFIKYCERNT